MRTKKRFLNSVFGISAFFVLLFSIFFALLFCKPFYSIEYNLHRSEIAFSNLSKVEYVHYSMEIVDYFFNNDYYIEMRDLNGNVIPGYFTEEEVRHMIDVKHLVRGVTLIFAFSLFCFLLLFRFVERRKVLRIVSFASLSFIGVLFLMSVWNFNAVFIAFHKTFFRNNFWLLPENTKLIEMFPEGFFYDFAKVWFITFAIVNGIIYIITTFYTYFFRSNLSNS